MKDFVRTLLVFGVLSLITGILYPFLITGASHALFSKQAKGSLIWVDGKVLGSELIGQKFVSPKYFHGRPSAVEYDAGNSGASNFGPSNAKFLEEVSERVRKARAENYLAPAAQIPADLVLASGSGLDPDISLDSALLQVGRVAQARGLEENEVRKVVERLAVPPVPIFQAHRRVNVLRLNMAVDGITERGPGSRS